MLTELERLIEYRRHAGRLDPVEVQPIPVPEVRLTVLDGEMPSTAPADLAESIVWLEDRGDWALKRLDVAAVERYLTWRSTWESSFTIGTAATLRHLRDAVRQHDLQRSPEAEELLGRLIRGGADGAPVARHEVATLRSMVSGLVDHVRAAGTAGVALVEFSPTVQRTGLLRSWPIGIAEAELSSRGTATVRFSGGRLGLWFADDRDPIEQIHSFELGALGGIVIDGAGEEHLVDVDATAALCGVAPEATAWRVRTVPEVLVWANVSAALETAVDEMERTGSDASIRLGDLRHDALTVAH